MHQLAYHRAWITRTGRPVAGDGVVPLVHVLYPGSHFRIEIFDSGEVMPSGKERSDELRMPSPSSADGAVVILTWRSALLPWRRKRSAKILMFGQPEIELSGRRARRVIKDMNSLGPGSSPRAIKLELARANGGSLPMEQSIQDRYPRAIGEIHPAMLGQRSLPERVQLYLGTELLADGRLEGYEIFEPPVDIEGNSGASPDPAHPIAGFVTVDDKKFQLNASHRLRVFAR